MVQPGRRHHAQRDLLPSLSWGAGGNGSAHAKKNGGLGSGTGSDTASVLGFDFRTPTPGGPEGFVPVGPRQWLKYDAQGRVTVIPAEKRPLIEELRLPFRDAVMVNPLVPTPYPPAILIRDCALVLNLGALRACVGADQVILLSIPDASSEHWAFPTPGGRFERELAARLAGLSPTLGGNGGLGEGPPPPALPSAAAALDAPAASGADLLAAGAALASPPPPPGALPFELRALEACLAEALADLSAEAAAVAERTLPALELLADGVAVTRRGLEAVRGSKLAIKRLEARINGLKRELEEIINDDDDMRDMLLTFRKGLSEGLAAATAAAEAAAAAAAATGATTDEERDEEGATEGSLASDEARPPLARRSLSPASTLRRRTPAGGAALAGPLERLASAGWAPVPLEPGTLAEAPEEEEEGAGGEGRAGQHPSSPPPHTHTHHATTHPPVVRAASHHDVAACESMLESYFMQADFLLSRLFVLKERIDDTEDLVGIELDTRRNELVALQLLVTLLTAALAVVSTVGSLLGMNLAPLPIEATVRPFYFITFGSIAGGAVLFLATLSYARGRRILWIPKVPRD